MSRAQRRTWQSLAASLLRYSILAFWSFVCLFPLYWLLVTSLKEEGDITSGAHFLPFVDFMPSLRAWTFILTDSADRLVPSFINSAVIALGSTLLTVIAAALAVYAVTRARAGIFVRQETRSRFFVSVFASRILPPAVLVLPVYIATQWTGLRDTHIALILVYAAVNLPVAIWLLRPVLGSRASEAEEAAQLDGATHLSILFTIVLPMAAAGVFAVGFLIFLQCWNEYLLAAHLATDRAITLPPFLVGQMSMKEAQIGSEAEEWANFSAASVLIIIPLLACTSMLQRFLGRISVWRG
jgi:multiple sugar transport system permease protein